MGWRDLLTKEDEPETIVAPWLGNRRIRDWDGQRWFIEGANMKDRDHGWYEFRVLVRKAYMPKPVDPPEDVLHEVSVGYLVGDRLVSDDVNLELDPARLARHFERVHLIEEGLDRFARVSAGRFHQGGPLIFRCQEMPSGPEEEVMGAFLDERPSTEHIPGVPPALDAAFRFETWQRDEAEKRRQEEARRRREEAERREREERRKRILERLGDGAGRREMAAVDFSEAARAALSVGGATYLDHRIVHRGHEAAVKFRMDGERYECTCDVQTLRIIDAGICLTDHYTGERGDNYFTLESLPGVIRQAEREGVLVVFRHA